MYFNQLDNYWYYEDGTRVKDDVDRKCNYCDLSNTPEGHDGCLGTLPNVMNACCGHGDIQEAYVQFKDKSCVRGESAISFFKERQLQTPKVDI